MELLGHTVKYSVVYFTSSNVINAVCINNVYNITILVKFARYAEIQKILRIKV